MTVIGWIQIRSTKPSSPRWTDTGHPAKTLNRRTKACFGTRGDSPIWGSVSSQATASPSMIQDCQRNRIIRCSIGPLSMARSRPPQDTFMEHSDILVVGAGSAGAAMAARLSEEPTLRVTLVEAGRDTVPGEVPDDIKDIFPRSFLNRDYFWPNLTASLTDGDAARPFPQARVVGGGSSVMGMIALRGLPSDYDGWEARGARNWGWRDVLPYFRAMTCDLDRPGPERNTSGPNIIHRLPREKWPLYMRRIEAAVASRGMKSLSDINETAEDGFFATPLSQDRERASSARCYLTPEVRRRPNLKIMTSASVRNLRIENGRVCGVVAKRDGETVILSASEVVVCAGAASPPAVISSSASVERPK
jgi:choline dehydrogenase-like flavoprotein